MLVENCTTAHESPRMRHSDRCGHPVTAYQGRAREPRGLGDGGAFVEHTFDVDHLKTPKAEREAIIETLRGGGLRRRAIAVATGDDACDACPD